MKRFGWLLLGLLYTACPAGLLAQLPAFQPNQPVNVLAGQANGGQYATGLFPWLVPQVLTFNTTTYTSAVGTVSTMDSVVIPKNQLNGLHAIRVTVGGLAGASSASTKSVVLSWANGTGTAQNGDSVKLTASSNTVWKLQCLLMIAKPVSPGGIQYYTCDGVQYAATAVFNLIARDTVTVDPADSSLVIRIRTSDSTAVPGITQNNLLIERVP